MNQAMFIVWRESVEALLIIGILHAWISQQSERRQAMVYLWGGVILGLLLSGLLALLILFAGEALAGPAGEWFQAALVLAASLLILQMVGWMRRHGPTLKQDLRNTVDATLDKRGGIGLLMLAMLAVGREGSETVVFLYGLGINKQGSELGLFAIGGTMGLALALLTFLVLQASSRIISWRRFFAFSEIALLLLGAALLIAGLDRISGQLMSMDLSEQVYAWFGDAVWDTSSVLSDTQGLGSILASFAGYRAAPSAATLVAFAGYWSVVGYWLRRPVRQTAPGLA